ncbi:MAG: TrkH family potassium uptake protein [Pelagibacteraceae bacterium]|nr:TrkH family potassium uptake protein [Pelagibacteraceae bacterium]MCI5078776.1 TrkH family potassium uptake protein [Pelagibacteraceae bacterium]
MNSGLKTTFLIIGYLIIILSGFMIIPHIVEMTIGDKSQHFLVTGILSAFIGTLLVLISQTKDRSLNVQQAFLMTNLAWLSICFFGAIPLYFSSLDLTFTDAFFESVSGITTTGSTILPDIERASKGILVWRSLLQWLGGIGIIVMAITILPLLNIGGMQLFRSEGMEVEKVVPKVTEIALSITKIYIFITILCSLAYWLAGMNVFDAINHALTTVSTGGYSTHSQSIGYFNSSLIEVVAIIFIITGSIPFLAYIKFTRGDLFVFFKDKQIIGFFLILAVSILIITIHSYINRSDALILALRDAAFNVTSIITGTGYTTKDFSAWGNFSVFFFLVLMFVGGCSASTTCGIKVFRFQIILSFIDQQVKKIFYPNGVFPIKYNNQNINDQFLTSVLAFVCLYIFIFFILTLLLSLTGLDLITSVSAAATSISNVGPGLGHVIGPDGNFFILSDSAKWLLSLGMLLGRLELLTVLVLFLPAFWRN